MPIKHYIMRGSETVSETTFRLPDEIVARTVHLVGDFNQWDRLQHPLHRDPNGGWSLTIELDSCRLFRYRYLLDGRYWLHDECADAQLHIEAGPKTSVVVTDPVFDHIAGGPGAARP